MDGFPESLIARWGRVAARSVRLESEIDATYRVTLDDGTAVILKIAAADTGPAELDFEMSLVEAALAADPGLPLARTIRTPDGDTRLPSEGRWARLVECLPGSDATSAPVALPVVRAVGREAGRLTRALEGFRHPADERLVAWDIRRAPGLRRRVALVPGTAARKEVEDVLGHLDDALPLLAALPTQVVHNDLNGGNVLLQGEKITGIVDLGDAAFAPRAGDLGIAMSYTLGYTDEPDVWAAPAAFLAGYRDVVDLRPDELALLPLLVRARAAQRILMSVGSSTPSPGEGRRDESARIRRASDDLRRLIAADPVD